jgi:hypothetical protein
LRREIRILEDKLVGFEEGETQNTVSDIEDLTEKFNILMWKYSRECSKEERVALRVRLANIAFRIKTLKKEFHYGE